MGLVSWPTLNPLVSVVNWAYVPGEGDRGAYGVGSGELVGEMTMMGVRLLGGVGGLLWDDGRSLLRENLPSFLLSNEAVDQDQSLWYRCDDSG